MASTFFILKAGIAPPDLARYPDAVKLMFWQWVTEAGLKRKDWELARGLNARGEHLPGVALATRKHRRSEMTPSGKGDPTAPYLMPGRGLSRTRSLLAGKAHTTYAEFFWRYDAHTGDQWGRILAHHAARGKAYDVVGLSPAGIASVAQQAQKRWRQWLLSPDSVLNHASAFGRDEQRPHVAQGPVGTTNLKFAVFGMGGTKEEAQKAIDEGRSSGFMTQAEWTRYFRQKRGPIPTALAPSVRKGASNVLLQHVWSTPPRPTPTALQKAAMPPVAPPKPKPKPTPKPAPPVRPPVRTPDEAAEMARRLGVKATADPARVAEKFGEEKAKTIPAYYEARDETIHFNPRARVWADPDGPAKLNLDGWWASESFDDLVHHEVAHHLHRLAAGLERFDDMSRLAVSHEIIDMVERHLGRYATKNQIELVAEVYVRLKAGRSVPREILDYYDSLKGPRP